MDVVMITRDRPELTEQCIRSMRENAADWSRHRLVVVFDGTGDEVRAMLGTGSAGDLKRREIFGEETVIVTGEQLGVGGAKNFGAAWFRGNARRAVEPPALLMFSDNDMWFAPGWDHLLEIGMTAHSALLNTNKLGITQLGGWRHPYHQLGRVLIDGGWLHYGSTHQEASHTINEVDAVTGNCFVIRWADWLKYGPFDSNAIGPGQSEDFALSQRIRAGGGLVATLDPPVAIHCGLVNSIGEPATGWRECEQQITEQLAGLSAEMRESVLIMRPAPELPQVSPAWLTQRMLQHFDGLVVGPNTELPDGRTVAEAGLEPGPIVASQYAPGSHMTEVGTWDFGYPHAGALAELLNDAAGTKTSWDGERYATYGALESAGKRLDMQTRNAPRQLIAGLNLCSGQRRFDPALGWANLDGQCIYPERVPDIVWQADEPLPFGDATMSYVAIVHALEHFGCGESVPLLRECHRVLRPGGSLIIVVPDMKRLAARWLSGEISEYIFNVNCYGAYISDERDRHRWSMSRESLPNLLGEAGTWSKIGEFDYREIAGSDFPRDWWMLAMEAVK